MKSHDVIVSHAVEIAKRTDRKAVIRAFVGSLTTKNLPARSAFGSLMVLQKFKAHKFQPSRKFDGDNCGYCGLGKQTDYDETTERVEAYPFQVQHTDIQYAAFDLESFPDRTTDEPKPQDIDCLRKLFDAIRALPAGAQLTELNQCLTKVIKSNKYERMILLETLGYAGILCPRKKDHYSSRFVTFDEANSDQPKEYYKQEWEYPVRFWTGKDGVNETAVQSIFKDFLK
jgi:hypothetical protein